jgi:hypothetical protein
MKTMFGWYKNVAIMLASLAVLLLPVWNVVQFAIEFILEKYPDLLQSPFFKAVIPLIPPAVLSFFPKLLEFNWFLSHSILLLSYLSFRVYKTLTSPPSPYPKTIEELQALTNNLSEPLQSHYFQTKREKVRIHYTTIGSGPLLILCGNGLGCSVVYSYPLLKIFDKAGWLKLVTVVCWDYRGLFKSVGGTEKLGTASYSIRDSALDAVDLLDELGAESCYAYFGWSTGVQVGLELASLFPEKVGKLVLLNGGHGQLLHAFGQPFFRVPLIGDYMHYLRTFLGW